MERKLMPFAFTAPGEKREPISLEIELADSARKRFLGLMGRKSLPPGRGLLLAPCSSIHMCFMRFAIDVIYLDKEMQVLKIASHIRPWLGMSCCFAASSALELADGEAKRLGIKKGMTLKARHA